LQKFVEPGHALALHLTNQSEIFPNSNASMINVNAKNHGALLIAVADRACPVSTINKPIRNNYPFQVFSNLSWIY